MVDSSRGADRLLVRRRLTYFGFELERDEEAIDDFPPGREADARRALALALARGEARHPAVRRHRRGIEEIRELYRRSGGLTPRLSLDDLAVRYEHALAEVSSMTAFRGAALPLDLSSLVDPVLRDRLAELPSSVEIRGKWIPVDYDVEEGREGTLQPVARLRLPEKMARTLVDEELPALDRPLRFVVMRGARGAVRADTLDGLREVLDRPWSPDERPERPRPGRGVPRDRAGHGGRPRTNGHPARAAGADDVRRRAAPRSAPCA